MLTLRHDLRPGDLGRMIELHGVLYAQEWGFDCTFEAYVAAGAGELRTDGDRLWSAEQDGRLVGTIAILVREDRTAQLRWFLVHPDARRQGLGRRLMDAAVAFSRDSGCRSVYLWTVDPLVAAARLYTAAGFRLTEEKPRERLWGHLLAEQRYDLPLV